MKNILRFLLLLLITHQLSAQTSIELKGNKYFNNYSFSKAIAQYKTTEYLTVSGQRNLALCYKNLGEFQKSADTYSRFYNEATPEDIFNYASVLRIIGEYEKSDLLMKKFHELLPDDSRGKNFTANSDKLPIILKDDGKFKVYNLDVNTPEQDFGPAYYNKRILFASSREGVKPIKRIYNWNQIPFLNIYVADAVKGQLKNPRKLDKEINKKFHEGPASYSPDENLIAYTRNNYKSKSADGVVKLEIFFTERGKNGTWKFNEPFFLNNKDYSVGHPCLTKDGKTMYFASDMPGGFGGVDIYMVTKDAYGTWSKPINLGKNINTEGNEMFPFYHEGQGVLLFASNGHFGLGGLDIFYAQKTPSGEYNPPINMGNPINSNYDDFALIIDADWKSGYFSSNRPQGRGDDDIYGFEVLKPLQFKKILKGTSLDQDGKILAQTKVSLYDADGKYLESVVTDETGKYEFAVETDKDWKLDGVKEKYSKGINSATTKTPDPVVIADVVLTRTPEFSLYVLITEKQTGKPINSVKVTLTNSVTKETEVIYTPATGDFMRPLLNKLNDKISYNLKLEASGYLAKTATYTKVLDREGQYNVHEALDLTLDKIIEGETRLETLIEINPIYFDLNKYNIRPDAAKELDKIVKVMNENPTMVVELGSHTDCRSSYAYNETLSDNRAKASAAYIKARITNPDRIYGKGYGESQLKVDCPCEGAVKSNCSEEQHQMNRRTEFKIIKM